MSSPVPGAVPWAARHPYLWLSVNGMVPVLGLLFFGWTTFEVIYTLIFQMMLAGGAGVLRVLFSLGGRTNYITMIPTQIMWAGGFLMIYTMMFMFFLAFLLTSLDLKAMTKDLNFSTGVAMEVLALNYLVDFIANFILNGKFRTAQPFTVFFTSIGTMMPQIIILVFIAYPALYDKDKKDAASLLHQFDTNLLLAIGLILVKLVIDIITMRLQKGKSYIMEPEAELPPAA